jgi:hypothetical protein
MDLGSKLLVLGLVAVAIWLAWRGQYVFVVRIERGVPRLSRGRVTPAFLQRLGEVCAEAGIERGWVGGARRGKQIALHFSRSIPPGIRQRLRNQWPLHG